MIKFSRYYFLYLIISLCVLLPGLYSLIMNGLHPSIDFIGGTLGEIHLGVEMPRVNVEKYANRVGIANASIIESSSSVYFFRLPAESEVNIASLSAILNSEASASATITRIETVGPLLGKELLQKAIIAAIMAITGILLYVAYAFKNMTFGIAAVIALAHDLLVMLGVFSLLGKYYGVEVDTLFITALLTTMSFSVHDTIVVFDRIREMLKKGEGGTLQETSDLALTQTMVRSLTNSFTIIFMLVALVLLGGNTIKWFAVALLIGTISGTYSSPFVATPVLNLLYKIQQRRK